MKKIMERYWHPTPKKWRKRGDAILAVGTAITGGGMLGFDAMVEFFGHDVTKWIIGGSFIAAAAGKYITNLFKEDNTGGAEVH